MLAVVVEAASVTVASDPNVTTGLSLSETATALMPHTTSAAPVPEARLQLKLAVTVPSSHDFGIRIMKPAYSFAAPSNAR